MLDEKDLQAIAQLIDVKLSSINDRLDKIEENTEITRDATNRLVEWAENVSNSIRFPLPKL